MKKTKKMNLIQAIKDSLLRVFHKDAIHIIFYDLLFYFIFVAVFMIIGVIMSGYNADLSSITDLAGLGDASALALQTQTISKYVSVGIVFLILGLIISILSFFGTRYLIWTTISAQKRSLKSCMKFKFVGFIWSLLLLFIIFIISRILDAIAVLNLPSAVYYLVFGLIAIGAIKLFILTNLLFLLSVNSKGYKALFKGFISSAMQPKKISLTILSIILYFICWTIVSYIFGMINNMLMTILNFAILIHFIIWVKYYIYDMFK